MPPRGSKKKVKVEFKINHSPGKDGSSSTTRRKTTGSNAPNPKQIHSRQLHLAVSLDNTSVKRSQSYVPIIERDSPKRPATANAGDSDDELPLPHQDSNSYYITAEDAEEGAKKRRTKAPKKRRVSLVRAAHTLSNADNILRVQIEHLHEWKAQQNTFLDEMTRREGLAGQDPVSLCAGCSLEPGLLRCEDCVGSALLCHECMCEVHRADPLHRLQVCAIISCVRLECTNHSLEAMEWPILRAFQSSRSGPYHPGGP